MEFISTRGKSPKVGFEQALLEGLAPDGGLYVPTIWPLVDQKTQDWMAEASFAEVAALIISKFSGDAFDYNALLPLAEKAYGSFSHPQTTPVSRFGEQGAQDWLLELYHGPTLAFKDVAMQFLGQLFASVLKRQNKRVTIIGATSGDTGAAAIEAFRGLEQVDVFILHPHGRVSDVQRRIMTSVNEPNIFNIAVDGTFDDCQRIVKELFADRPLTEQLSLGGVNSINWVRLAVQIVYYFTTAAALKEQTSKLSFVAPTGNFGDIFAGYAAKKMGAPIDRLCIAVNDNDILYRAITTGRYQPLGVKQTTSPSMDIQVASNFERLIFEASGRDASVAQHFVDAVGTPEGATIPAGVLDAIAQDFIAEKATEAEVAEIILDFSKGENRLIDPHTAVGIAAMRKARAAETLTSAVVTLSTAHAAKFPDSVEAAAGARPSLPSQFSDLNDRPETCMSAPADRQAIKDILMTHAKAAGN